MLQQKSDCHTHEVVKLLKRLMDLDKRTRNILFPQCLLFCVWGRMRRHWSLLIRFCHRNGFSKKRHEGILLEELFRLSKNPREHIHFLGLRTVGFGVSL